MNEFEGIIDELLILMNENKIPIDIQIKYLKELNQIININKKNELICTFGTGIISSSFGLGMMSLATEDKQVYLSVLLIFLGFIICLVGRYNDIKLNNDEKEKIKEINQQIKTYINK